MLLHVGDNSFQQERGSSNVCREEVRFQTTENKLYQESNPNTGEKHTKENVTNLPSTIKTMIKLHENILLSFPVPLFIIKIKKK